MGKLAQTRPAQQNLTHQALASLYLDKHGLSHFLERVLMGFGDGCLNGAVAAGESIRKSPRVLSAADLLVTLLRGGPGGLYAHASSLYQRELKDGRCFGMMPPDVASRYMYQPVDEDVEVSWWDVWTTNGTALLSSREDKPIRIMSDLRLTDDGTRLSSNTFGQGILPFPSLLRGFPMEGSTVM